MEQKCTLIESEALYRAVVEICPDSIVVVALDGSIIRANTAAAHLHGYERSEDLIGSSLLDVVHPDERSRLGVTLGDVLTTGTIRHIEHRLLRGQLVFPAELNFSLLRDDDGTPLVVVAVIHDMTARRQLEEELRYQALHDSLTGLPNRTVLYDRVDHALAMANRSGVPVSLLVLDLVRFKEVNDTLGHQTGDVLLHGVALRLKATLRESDTVVRLGGDEFAILLASTDRVNATVVAEKIHTALRAPLVLGDRQIEVGVSIGIAQGPTDGADTETLLGHADMAMYAAKRAGKKYAIYPGETPMAV